MCDCKASVLELEVVIKWGNRHKNLIQIIKDWWKRKEKSYDSKESQG